MTIAVEDGTALVGEVFVDGHSVAELHAVVGPRRSFGLKVEAQAVGSDEGGLGRAVAVEAHVVEAKVLANTENAFPGGGVGGREACLGETAVLHGAAQVDGTAVEKDVPAPHGDLSETKGDAYGLAVIDNRGRVELWRVFVPGLRSWHMHEERLFVDGDVCDLAIEVGDDALLVNRRCGAQFYAPGDAVPVALGLVGYAVGVLSDADVLDTVVNTDGNLVVVAEAEVRGDVILMRDGKAHLVAYRVTVDDDGGLDVRTLEEEGDLLAAPGLGNGDGAAVGDLTHEVFPRGKEEGEGHIAGPTVGLHEGIEVVAGVVEGAGPSSGGGDVVAEAVGEE